MDRLQVQALIEKKFGNTKSLYCQDGAIRFKERTMPLLERGYIKQEVAGGDQSSIRRVVVYQV